MPAATIDEVIERLQQMQLELAPGDGVRWFNRLYLDITVAIRDYCRSGKLKAPPFLEQLDVHFGNVYFDVFDAAAAGAAVPAHWAPMFDSRSDRNVAPLQFALAGLNSHIGYDLSIGVVALCESLSIEPTGDSPQHADYEAVNVVLKQTEAATKRWLLTGAVKELDHAVAPVDDAVAIWSIERARDSAWTTAQVLWHLRGHDELLDSYLTTLNATVAMEGKALLMPHAVPPSSPLYVGVRLAERAIETGFSLLRHLIKARSGAGV
jgi:hypothetical protein